MDLPKVWLDWIHPHARAAFDVLAAMSIPIDAQAL
jgi:hypothetical protein